MRVGELVARYKLGRVTASMLIDDVFCEGTEGDLEEWMKRIPDDVRAEMYRRAKAHCDRNFQGGMSINDPRQLKPNVVRAIRDWFERTQS